MLTSLQEIFDRIWQRFVVEAAPRGMSRPDQTLKGWQSCMYRGANGACCFVGSLIPDDKYRPDMEDKTVMEIIECQITRRGDGWPAIFDPILLPELKQLQIIHDQYTVGVRSWTEYCRESLTWYAMTYGLTIPNYEGAKPQ